jgi:uncharacterized protein (DUF934 family)
MSALIEFDQVSGLLRGTELGTVEMTLLSTEDWTPESDAGLLLAVDDEPQAEFAKARLIAVEFSNFHDGRGLSLAVLLRTRIGYAGELRAVGDIHPDLIHYLLRCGFDSFLLPEGRHVGLDDAVLAPYSDYYQASVVEPHPAFRRGRSTAYLGSR